MRNKIIYILILTGIFILFIIVKVFFLDQREIYGAIKVTSSPQATVFLNNVAIGKTPLEQKQKVGEYIIKIIPEGEATQSASFTGKIKIYKNSLSYVNTELGFSDLSTAADLFYLSKMENPQGDYGEIYVETEPEGAIVSLDNDEKGPAPLIMEKVLKGEHEISIFLPGFFRRTQKININPGFRLNAFFKLAFDESQKSISSLSEKKESTESATIKKYVIIQDSPTGWLRVRSEPLLSSSESAKVKVGEKYEFLDEEKGWYKIKYNNNEKGLLEGSFTEGWISSNYAKIEEEKQ